MKRIISCLIVITLLFCSCANDNNVISVNDSQELSTEITIEVSSSGTDYAGNNIITDDVKTDESSKSSINYSNDTSNQNAQTNVIETENAKNVVTLSVNCKNAIDYFNLKNDDSYDKILPSNGEILSARTLIINDGDTVLSVVKRALNENNTIFSITPGGYIHSISGLAEKKCGPTSGWLYKVNGVLPNVSTKSYVVKPDDVIEIVFTCKNGDV